MAEHIPPAAPELGAEMDYAEHDKTYVRFLSLAKYGTLICAALLIAMVAGFFGGFGFVSATILFVLICAVGGFLLG